MSKEKTSPAQLGLAVGAIVLALAFSVAANFICHDAMGAFGHEMTHVALAETDRVHLDAHLGEIFEKAHMRLTILTFASMLVFGGGAGYVARKWLPKG